MTINGLPLHPLVVHLAVVLAPVAGLLAVGHLVPRWQRALRWWVLVLPVAAAVTVWFAATTGSSLEHSQFQGVGAANSALAQAIHHHEDLAGKLQASTWVLAGLAVVVWFLQGRMGRLHLLAAVLFALCGVAAIVLCVLTGDAGAKAVWVG